MTVDRESTEREAGPGAFQNILVVLRCEGETAIGTAGGDEDALLAAGALARASGARLTAIAVVNLATEIERLARYTGETSAAIEQRLVKEHEAALAETVARAAPDAAIEAVVRIGKPFIEIIRDVLEHNRDLVIKTVEAPTGLQSYFFTSTDQHLLRKCPCPVWLRASSQSRSVRAVLAAVDVDEDAAGEPDTQAGLNRAILNAAGRIAAFENAELHVLHVWDAPGEGLVRRWGNGDDSAERYVRDLETKQRRALYGLVSAFFGEDPERRSLRVSRHLIRDEPRTAIPAALRRLSADVLVMGTVARTGVPGLIIGNTAEDVLNSIDCSVVTVKPPGYQSPIART